MKIDTAYNFQKEVGTLDPDKYSATLQEYHRLLWSKPLPNGKLFQLSKVSGNRLYHKSEIGEFYLSSDRVVPSFSRWKRMESLIVKVPKEELEQFNNLAETIGGIVIWPSDRIDGMPTINAERGFNRRICDRIDLTIECIRRLYLEESSPMTNTLNRYGRFFEIFGDFKGYIDFFLLHDLVTTDYTKVNIAPPFINFETQPIPQTVSEYMAYIEHMARFVQARNKKIEQYANAH